MANVIKESNAIYADHASTSFPKPSSVAEAMSQAVTDAANAGRSGHPLALSGARILFGARRVAGRLLGVSDPRRVVLTAGCTDAINTVIHGLGLTHEKSIVTTNLEHNAVARPLRELESRFGLSIRRVKTLTDGRLPPGALENAVDETTALVAVQHASNLTGVLQDLRQIRRESGKIPLLVDAAQTAGRVPIDVDSIGIDFLAVPGHKGLMGPSGIGLLCLGENAPDIRPFRQGGTGSASESDQQPSHLPDRFEAGTPNILGAAGLQAGIEWVADKGVDAIAGHEDNLMQQFLGGIEGIDGLRETGPVSAQHRVAVASLVFEGQDPGIVARRLQQDWGILVRAGLHCTPWAHEHYATLDTGTVRISFGPAHTPEHVDRILEACRVLVLEV